MMRLQNLGSQGSAALMRLLGNKIAQRAGDINSDSRLEITTTTK